MTALLLAAFLSSCRAEDTERERERERKSTNGPNENHSFSPQPAAATSRSSQANDKLSDGSGQMLITEINGKKVSTLDDFVAAAKNVAPGSAGYVVARDLTSTSSPIGGRVSELTFNVARYPLQLFAWDQAKLDWVVVDNGGADKKGGGDKKGGDAAAAAGVSGSSSSDSGALSASDSDAGEREAVSAPSGSLSASSYISSSSSSSSSTKASSGGGGKPGGRSLLQQNNASAASSSSPSSSSSSSSSSNKPAAAGATSGASAAASGGGVIVDEPKPAVGPGAGAVAAEGGAAGGSGKGGSAASSSSSVPSSPRAASNVWSPEERARLKRGVVSVRASTDIPLGNAVRADASSSGFIASKDDGRLIIVTDARADNSPTEYTVFFYDGSSAKAKPLFSDYASFLEVELKDAPKNIEVLPVGSGLSDVPIGSRLMMVAASEDGTASDQEGTLLVRNSQLQTNINVARNSKAAPVLDSSGKVVAVHASNSEAGTLSFETPVSFFDFDRFFLFFLFERERFFERAVGGGGGERGRHCCFPDFRGENEARARRTRERKGRRRARVFKVVFPTAIKTLQYFFWSLWAQDRQRSEEDNCMRLPPPGKATPPRLP